MENLTLGINIIFPIFFVIFIGYYLKQRNIIDASFVSMSTKLVFYIALPAKLFFDIRNSEVNSIDLKYTMYLLLGITTAYIIVWFFARFFIKDKSKLSAFVHCAYRSNFIYIGMPIIESILNEIPMESAIIVITFGLTLYNILAIIVLTFYNGDKLNLLSFLIKVIKNPMIIAIVAGLVFKSLNIPIYGGIESGCNLLGKLSTPLSLILIGGSLDFSGGFEDFGTVISCAFIKDALIAMVMIPIGMMMNFSSTQLVVAYVFFATPCAVNCFIMGKQMGSDGALTSKIVTMSFALSIFTYSIGISLLRIAGII